tara:strand:- start:10341 stop:10595 length:255 start_codon:yes stop_codon:yes gene_type:complete
MTDSDARIKALEKEVAELKTSISSFGNTKNRKSKRADGPKKPSDYNLFLKKFMIDEKTKLGDKYDHKVAFGSAAKAWSAQKKIN